MATIYAGGSRRSANPTYTPFTPTRMAAVNTVPTMEEQLKSQFVTQAPQQQTPSRMSEALGRGLATVSGSGADATFGGNAAPGMAGTVGRIGYGTSLLGSVTGNPALSGVGGMLGLAGALGRAKTGEEALGVMAGPALSLMGVPAGAVSLAKAAVDANPTLAVNSLIGLVSPQLGILNGIASLLGLPSIGEVVAPRAPAGGSGGGYGSGKQASDFSGSQWSGSQFGIGNEATGSYSAYGGGGRDSGGGYGGANGRGFGGGNSGMGD